ncbi:MAG: methylamine utilization protein [Gammaproteobacteria bacterium]
MNTVPRCRLPAVALFAALGTQSALAGMVTVDVTARSTAIATASATAGASAADTVIVFDPLDATPVPSHDAAIVDQVDKKFVPRVSVVRTGTAITFPNSDRIRHQVYSFSHAKTFTLKLYAGSPRTAVIFDQPGLVILGCNIHDNMLAYVGVVDSPYFAKLSDSGTATLNLPAGRYRLRAWHPNAVAAVPPREISVAAAPISIPITINVDSTASAVAAWPE